ncbi:MAG: hypothetical protein PHU85_12985 [Phycisphaerae bacterium]|nr:hypothetical protein [Phycisphaerae bacterium]
MVHAHPTRQAVALPSSEQIRLALRLYVRAAYPAGPPESIQPLMPPDSPFDPLEWLSADAVQCERRKTDDEAAAFTLRLGNRFYPHMKFRLVRAPTEDVFLFMVDSHDSMVMAHARPQDQPLVRELNRRNAEVARAITAAWTEAGLPTERSWLRRRIEQGRAKGK